MATTQKAKARVDRAESVDLAEATPTSDELSSEDNVEQPSPGFVKYVGRADRRIITAKEFADLGVQSKTLEWNAGNEYMLRTDLLSEETVTALLAFEEFQAI